MRLRCSFGSNSRIHFDADEAEFDYFNEPTN